MQGGCSAERADPLLPNGKAERVNKIKTPATILERRRSLQDAKRLRGVPVPPTLGRGKGKGLGGWRLNAFSLSLAVAKAERGRLRSARGEFRLQLGAEANQGQAARAESWANGRFSRFLAGPRGPRAPEGYSARLGFWVGREACGLHAFRAALCRSTPEEAFSAASSRAGACVGSQPLFLS